MSVSLEGERRPSEIKVTRIAAGGREPVLIEHKKPHHAPGHKHADVPPDPARVFGAVKAEGWTARGDPTAKPSTSRCWRGRTTAPGRTARRFRRNDLQAEPADTENGAWPRSDPRGAVRRPRTIARSAHVGSIRQRHKAVSRVPWFDARRVL